MFVVVAPLAGARIEIHLLYQIHHLELVAPLAGARIEMGKRGMILGVQRCRSPRGSED